MKKNILILFIAMLFLSSCVAVKEYKKIYVNDPDMKLSSLDNERYESSFQVYREGASGANGGKTGGGCGCN
ncbi:MAG: DUF4266 domain-containing protein [Mariniphaga sp.]